MIPSLNEIGNLIQGFSMQKLSFFFSKLINLLPVFEYVHLVSQNVFILSFL
jgi:hypothetical protein